MSVYLTSTCNYCCSLWTSTCSILWSRNRANAPRSQRTVVSEASLDTDDDDLLSFRTTAGNKKQVDETELRKHPCRLSRKETHWL